jgi:hypothetical protein
MIGQIGYLGKVSLPVGVTSALLYTLGATLGASLIGLGLGALGLAGRWLLDLGHEANTPGVLLPVACLALVGGLRDLGFLRFRLPQPAKQVPRGWMEVFGPHKTGFLWGFAVGLAFSTMIQYTLYYVVALWILLAGSPLLGAQVLALYGLAQGVLLILDVLAMAADTERSAGLLGWGRTGFFFQFGGAVLLACSVFLAAQSGLVRLAAG